MAVIILIALNRSHMENGFAEISDVPLRPLAVTVETTVATRSDAGPHGRSERVIVIGERDFVLEDSVEGLSSHTGLTVEERKLDEII